MSRRRIVNAVQRQSQHGTIRKQVNSRLGTDSATSIRIRPDPSRRPTAQTCRPSDGCPGHCQS